jgi:hypothetical protein
VAQPVQRIDSAQAASHHAPNSLHQRIPHGGFHPGIDDRTIARIAQLVHAAPADDRLGATKAY